ncbi:MAG: FMN-binding protein, partial [Gemmatimonadetes bacterium]|nr:FMN-binding protein [Gemmatimonadota bacterium]
MKLLLPAVLGLVLSIAVVPAAAQRVGGVDRALYTEVMPGADRFDRPSGSPPVVTAFRTGADGQEVIEGYVFLTSDLPPEQFGYSGPIEALVGMRPDGTLSGVRVVDYRESYMRSMGDFLRRPGFQEQFSGKHIGDPFQLWGDIDGISRVSISVRALSRGVRDSARRVADAYGLSPGIEAIGGDEVDPVGLSWFELRQLGTVQRFEVTEPGEGSAGIALAVIENERLGEYLLGEALYARGLQSAERRGGAEHLVLYALDGSRLRLFRQQGWSVGQGGDTIPIDPSGVLSLGLPSGGVVAGEATLVGLMLLGGEIDISEPFSFFYDLGDLGTHEVEYVSRQARLARAEAQAAEAAAAQAAEAAAAETGSSSPNAVVTAAPPEVPASPDDSASPAGAAPEVTAEPDPPLASEGIEGGESESADAAAGGGPGRAAGADESSGEVAPFQAFEDESLLGRTLASTSW